MEETKNTSPQKQEERERAGEMADFPAQEDIVIATLSRSTGNRTGATRAYHPGLAFYKEPKRSWKKKNTADVIVSKDLYQ